MMSKLFSIFFVISSLFVLQAQPHEYAISSDEWIQVAQDFVTLSADGILLGMKDADESDVVSIVMVKGEKADEDVIKKIQKTWDDTTITFVKDELKKNLEELDLQKTDSKRIPTIKEQLDKFAAFKAAIFATYPPCEELGKVVAGNISRGIAWALNPDVPYPSEEERSSIKEKVAEFFSLLENYIVEKQPTPSDLLSVTHEKFPQTLANFLWRVDSPFFFHGKKVLSDDRFTEILKNSISDIDTILSSDSHKGISEYQTAPMNIREHIQRQMIGQTINLAKKRLIPEYSKDLPLTCTPDDVENAKQLIDSIRAKSR